MSVSASAPGRRRRAQSRPPGSSIMPTARVTGTYFVFGRDNHRCMSVQDTAASGGISGRRSITLSTKPKSLAISAVRK